MRLPKCCFLQIESEPLSKKGLKKPKFGTTKAIIRHIKPSTCKGNCSMSKQHPQIYQNTKFHAKR